MMTRDCRHALNPRDFPRPPQNRSRIGWVGSAFDAILTTKTFQKKTEEADAYRHYLEELARIPKAMLERDREVDNYLHNRDAIIKNDRRERQRELDENGLSGKLKWRMMAIKSAWLGSKEKRRGSGTTRTGKKPVGIGRVQDYGCRTVESALHHISQTRHYRGCRRHDSDAQGRLIRRRRRRKDTCCLSCPAPWNKSLPTLRLAYG